MKEKHRQDTPSRRHYTFSQKVARSLRPKFVYSGLSVGKPGWQDTEHRHQVCEILFVKKGVGTVVVGGRSYLVREGDLVVYNAGTPHLEYTPPDRPFEILFCAATGFVLGDLPPEHLLPDGACPVFSAGENRDFVQLLLERLVLEPDRKELFFKEIAEDLLKILLHLILRIHEPELREINLVFSEVKDYLDRHLEEEIRLDSLCKRFFVSQSYLSHIFRELAGVSPMKYLEKRRIDSAKTLLLSCSIPIRTVAEQCGYSDPCYFCRVFKSATGSTPLQFRKQGVANP